MEDLTKNQIVLLTLLVSFVTSIATGIVTVTLMDQAPQGVTQTVNRVVERTIERVVPGEPTERVVIREVPVEITQEQLVMDVINDSSPAVVRLETTAGENLGSGFVLGNAGAVLTVSRFLPATVEIGDRYGVSLRNGETAEARVTKLAPELGLALLTIESERWTLLKERMLASAGAATSTAGAVESWQPLGLSLGELALGQTVVALGFPEAGPLNVAVGIVSAVDRSATSTLARLQTNAANQFNAGGPILNVRGQVIGLSQEAGMGLAATAIQRFLDAPTPPLPATSGSGRSNRR
jgi:S1-C subfamily serine protease